MEKLLEKATAVLILALLVSTGHKKASIEANGARFPGAEGKNYKITIEEVE